MKINKTKHFGNPAPNFAPYTISIQKAKQNIFELNQNRLNLFILKKSYIFLTEIKLFFVFLQKLKYNIYKRKTDARRRYKPK